MKPLDETFFAAGTPPRFSISSLGSNLISSVS
jgi:hypothetical protein